MPKICIIVLIGLPGAGKTTFCHELIKKLKDNESFQCHTIIYDDIIDKKIYNSSQINFQEQYKKLRNQAFTIAEDHIKLIITSQDNLNHCIIVDDNMYYKSMRYEYYKLAKKYQTSFLQIYIRVALNTAILRNSKREDTLYVPEAIICGMASKLEVPGMEQWELNSLILESDSVCSATTFATVFETLFQCIEMPICIQDGHKTGALPAPTLQTLDLILRKITHEKIKTDCSKAEEYIRKKKDIFQKIKEGEMAIGAEWTESEFRDYLEKMFQVQGD